MLEVLLGEGGSNCQVLPPGPPPWPPQKLPQLEPLGCLQLPCSLRSSEIPRDRVRASELLFTGRKSFLLSGLSPSCCRELILSPDHYRSYLASVLAPYNVPSLGEDHMPSQLSSPLAQ
jgi:hypothetical protein